MATFYQPANSLYPAEAFKVRLTDPTDINTARAILERRMPHKVAGGLIVRGKSDVNTGYTWHLDPASFQFADNSLEICDGRASFVESGLHTYPFFCPWSASIEKLEPIPFQYY
ncbi:BP74-related protein [Streptomyces cinereoruber]|uniref:BP74-related protein n=1 Tax=Streptomyces cinereoruber TaxID=67260 RepID=UPI0036436F9E